MFSHKTITKVLLEHEAKEILNKRGLSVPRGIFIKKDMPLSSYEKELSELRFPVVAKVSSSEIRSKTDVKGIVFGIRSHNELKTSVERIMDIDKAEGVLVEEMAPPGIEVIVGGIIDENFGPIVMFGLGGIFVELFKDVSFCLAPMNRDDSLWLIKQIKGYSLLKGYRGNPPVDIESLIKIILSVSEMIVTSMYKEIDLNPVALYSEGAMILDAKIEIIS
jgi:acetyl-CoA synthetase (ADP-forming)